MTKLSKAENALSSDLSSAIDNTEKVQAPWVMLHQDFGSPSEVDQLIVALIFGLQLSFLQFLAPYNCKS
jgi:hypothetical protein